MNFNYCPKCGQKASVQKQDDTNYECTMCGWHFWNNAKATMALMFVQDGKLLLGRRGIEPRKGMLDPPGGFVDFGETIYQAAIREAKEELGVTIAQKDLEILEIYHNDYNPGVFTIDVVFLVRAWEGEFKADSDLASLEWHPFSITNDPSFAQKHYTGLDKLLARRYTT